MRIIHLVGTMCTGKTSAYEGLDIPAWDVHHFYKSRECYKSSGEMDWNKWREVAPTISNNINAFIKHNKTVGNKLVVIESGGSKHVRAALNQHNQHNHTQINLHTPSNHELAIRAERSKKPQHQTDRVLEFANYYRGQEDLLNTITYSYKEARLALKAILSGSLTIGIIGTAGRKDDEARMSKELYFRMYRQACQYIKGLGLRAEELSLVSGGAAWADHLAVSLYLADKAKYLTLHFPCQFKEQAETEQIAYIPRDNTTAQAANYYHLKFSGKLRGSSWEGLYKAIKKGAVTTVSENFKDRNLKIAEEAELLIAYTFSDNDLPKPGGTAHTWENCKGVKRHFSLFKLRR